MVGEKKVLKREKIIATAVNMLKAWREQKTDSCQ